MSAAALPVPLWAEILVSMLMMASAVFTLAAAIGLVRLQSFFQRMHPPALIYTGAAWCVTLASITYFSAQGHGLVLHVWIIIILLSITVPIAITSPTDFICVVKRSSAAGNFSNAKRGILVTT